MTPPSEEPTADRGAPASPGSEVARDDLGEQTEASDAVQADVQPVPPARPGQRVMAWCRQRRVAVIALASVLASAVAAGSVYWWLYRPDQLTGDAAQQQVIAAAREGIEAALSYSPENLETDLANAKSHLTGQFLDYYSDFTQKVVTPAATQKGVKTEANVARAAVSQMRPDKADVLVFVNQVTTSKDRPTPALATSTVMVTMVKSGDRWLIAEFNPV